MVAMATRKSAGVSLLGKGHIGQKSKGRKAKDPKQGCVQVPGSEAVQIGSDAFRVQWGFDYEPEVKRSMFADGEAGRLEWLTAIETDRDWVADADGQPIPNCLRVVKGDKYPWSGKGSKWGNWGANVYPACAFLDSDGNWQGHESIITEEMANAAKVSLDRIAKANK